MCLRLRLRRCGFNTVKVCKIISREENTDEPELPAFIEFETLAEEYCRVNQWPKLATKFNIDEYDMPLFHQSFVGQGRV